MSEKVLLEIKNVSKSFGNNQVLKNVSFKIKEVETKVNALWYNTLEMRMIK